LATLVAHGQRVRDIAALTGRSEGTIRWHLNKIFRKQGISGQADLARRVLSLDGFPRYRPRRTS
jgi:DNA-binding NarL/FixJ family response regulator